MITKSLINFHLEQKDYQDKLNKCQNDEEISILKKEYLNNLKLYLFESNNIIKEVFNKEITPYKNEDGYNALYKGNANKIVKKSKAEFNKEIETLKNSDIYYISKLDKKELIDTAFYVLKTYYEDNLD